MPRPQPRPALAKAPVRDHPAAPTTEPDNDTAPATAVDPLVLMSTRLHHSTRRRLKIHAAATGQPIQVIVEDLIVNMLDNQHVN